ncbi:MAG TPA: aldehyde dehydrogenase family protein [Propionibacteriaceae bacterium]|nr:aldehyde dehydrogenase family protein [Propionibacteriaceae bacterium]
MKVVEQYIDGHWVAAFNGRVYETRNPWSGEVVATVAAGDADDARKAIAAAHRAFPSWSHSAPRARQEIYLRAAEVLARRHEEIIELLADETGCGRYFAEVQTSFSISLLRQCAALPYAPIGQVLPSDDPGTVAVAVRRPVGVVGAIAPWNASLILSGRAIAGPMALGNTVVLKPSEKSPQSGGSIWAEIFQEAGLPSGVLNVVTHAPGEASFVGDELIASSVVRRLNFTGSTVTGRKLAEAAGRQLKRMVLQLGGQNPLIILDGVDLDYAVNAAAYGSFVHQGQICMCSRRIFVEASIAEEFKRRFAEKVASLPVGDPRDPSTVIGPVVNEWALSMLERRVEEAVERGARVLVGGVAQPPCFPPTVLTDVPDDIELGFDETFGPVVVLEVVADREAAIERANSSSFGLTAAVLAGDTEEGRAVAARLHAGIVHINDQPVNDEPQMPFGGVKDSGWGRFGVGFAAEEFTELQWMTTRHDKREFPF